MHEEAFSPVVDAIIEETGMPRSEVVQALESWEEVPGYIGNELVAGAIIKGTEIHFAVAADKRRQIITRKKTQDFLAPLLERLGFLTTRIPLERKDQQRFVERVGFEKTWADSVYQYYILTHAPFERTQHD